MDTARCYRCLRKSERERADRFRSAADRDRWIRARLAVREIIADRAGVPLNELEFTDVPNHKPRLTIQRGGPPWFSWSHAGEWALLALADEWEVGADVERVHHFPEIATVAERVFVGEELEYLSTMTGSAYTQAFFKYWTRKEALIKATGEGFSADLKSIEVRSDSENGPALLRFGQRNVADWQLHDLRIGPSYCAAVSVNCASRLTINLQDYQPGSSL